MPGLITLSTTTKKVIAGVGTLTLALFFFGILIGYLVGRPSDNARRCSMYRAAEKFCSKSPYSMKKEYRKFYYGVVNKFSNEVCIRKDHSCHKLGLPRNYIAYHLGSKTITIDGRGTDQAWAEVPWTENFLDMRTKDYPKPRFVTKFKVRWDDSKLYVLAYVQDTDIWTNVISNDTVLWTVNQVEMLIDVDGSLQNYKQVQVDPKGTFVDMMLVNSPFDIGGWNKGGWTKAWSAGLEHATYIEGTANNANDRDKYWSVELALTFSALAENSSRPDPKPTDNEAWFMQFGRSQWKLNVTANNNYTKTLTNGQPTVEWWSWQPCGTVNLHLQDRWGLVQFKRNMADKNFQFVEWHIYRALFDVFNGMKKYKALNGIYTDAILDLEVPVYLLSRVCVEVPTIKLLTVNGTKVFDVSVQSRIIDHPPAHINSEKHVWCQ